MSALFKKIMPDAKALTDHEDGREERVSGDLDNRAFLHQDEFVTDNFLQDVGDNDLFFLGEDSPGLSDKRYEVLLQERQPLCQLAREDRDVVVCVLTPVLIEKGYRPVVAEGCVAQLLQEHNSLTVAELETVIEQFDDTGHETMAPGELSIEEMSENEVVLPEPAVVLSDSRHDRTIPSLHQRTLAIVSPVYRWPREIDGAIVYQATRSLNHGERTITLFDSPSLNLQPCAAMESVLPPELLSRVADRIGDQE
ncbi:MAG: hypothetical protein B0D91_06800 [Oceanospirillales bacterium LUC14_002_19_P2]|nr:MAG: hypothetical protein B0D91_06800 [Oceanospirillales bacterium LUC14_002_19_P2]